MLGKCGRCADDRELVAYMDLSYRRYWSGVALSGIGRDSRSSEGVIQPGLWAEARLDGQAISDGVA